MVENHDCSLREWGKLTRATFEDAIVDSGEKKRMHGFGVSRFTDKVYETVCGHNTKEMKSMYGQEIRDAVSGEMLFWIICVECFFTNLLNYGHQYDEIKAEADEFWSICKSYELAA